MNDRAVSDGWGRVYGDALREVPKEEWVVIGGYWEVRMVRI